MDTIRVFIGSEPCQREHYAERVLEHSIRKHVTGPVDIHWMRAGDPGWETSERGTDGSWRVGKAVHGGWVKAPGSWGTGFSGFRWAIPELCGFEGHAIYLDADQLVLADIRELWDLRPTGDHGVRCISHNRTDVMVMDCAWFGRKQWPPLSVMKPSGWRTFEYLRHLHIRNGVDPTLPVEWNDCDGMLYSSGRPSKLLHYTTVPDGQPWRPYPNITYPTEFPYCRNRQIGQLWWDELRESLQAEHDQQHAADIYSALAAAR